MAKLFNSELLSEFVENFKKNLFGEIDRLEITDSSDVEQLVNKLKERYTIKPLLLKTPQPSEPVETMRERANSFREKYMQKAFEINVTIPFEGNSRLFNCMPSRTTHVYFDDSIYVNSNWISVKIVLDDLDPNKYNQEVNKIIQNLSINIITVNFEIDSWNNSLDGIIRVLLEKRKGLVSKKHSFMQDIGLSVNPKSETYIPSPVRIKTIPVPATETTKGVKKEEVPKLKEDVYKDIKEVLYNVGKSMERKPSLYKDKDEEGLRDVLLLFLETRYDSTTGVGEAFNKKGKTDILLKYAKDGSNLFVAECKIWKGQGQLHKAIDQLLGYLTHRDTQAALIIFVNQQDFTSVLDTTKEEIKKHAQFKKYVRDSFESSFSYEFTLPGDPQKVIQLELIFFHFPPVK